MTAQILKITRPVLSVHNSDVNGKPPALSTGLRDSGVQRVEPADPAERRPRQGSLLQLLRLRLRGLDGQEPAAPQEDGALRHVADEGQGRQGAQR